MGVVYVAYDPELDRRVALKLLHPDRDSTEAARSEGGSRLMREARALAQLNHPNVVGIHDVGTIEEQVWIAMELVRGRTLADWASEQSRPWREKLAVLQQAGEGLRAAHGAGILHRDFKPENVMVGADRRVRVMDFGLARVPVTGSSEPETEELGDRSGPDGSASHELELTAAGALVGTPAYMSAEQFAGEPATAASDQFSFCVMAWELLFGERPFAGHSVHELAAAVIDGTPRPPPRKRQVPRWLRRVCERGLSPHPRQRFDSMDQLLGAMSRGQSRARLRRVGVVLALVSGLAVVAVLAEKHERDGRVATCAEAGREISGLWSADLKRTIGEAIRGSELSYADATAERVVPWLDEYAERLGEHRQRACTRTSVDLDWSEDRLDRASWCLDERQLEFDALTRELAQAQESMVARAVSAAASLPPIDPCLDETVLDNRPPPPTAERRDSIRDVRAQLARTATLEAVGRYPEGLAIARDARAKADALEWPPLRAQALTREGRLLERSGEFEEAEQALADAYIEAANAGDWIVATTAAARLAHTLGIRQRRHDEAQTWSRHQALAISQAGDPGGLRRAQQLGGLANILNRVGEYDEAEALHREALEVQLEVLGHEHPQVATTRNNLAAVLFSQKRYDEAIELYGSALELRETVLGPKHPFVATTLSNLAVAYKASGKLADAVELHERALEIRLEALGTVHPDVASSYNNFGNLRHEMGEDKEALRLLTRALELRRQTLGVRHPETGASASNLARIYVALGRHEEALPLFEEAHTVSMEALGGEHSVTALVLVELAESREALGDHRRAIEEFRQAASVLEGSAENAPVRARAHFGLARSLGADDPRDARAQQEAERAAKILRDSHADDEALRVIETWLAGPSGQSR
jgi:tetratricopeptide (TPR) repeat protein